MRKIVFVFAFVLAAALAVSQPAYQGFYVNSPDGLNMRENPELSSKKIGVLRYCDFVFLLQRGNLVKIDGIEAHWTKIAFGEEEGWVFGGYLQAECPMNEDEIIAHLRKNDPLIADFFPMDYANYIREGEEKWSKDGAEYSKSLENLCAEYFDYSRTDAVAIRDCLFLAFGRATSPSRLRLLKTSTEIQLQSVSSWGIKDEILFPIYTAVFSDESGNFYGQIRGIDITNGNNVSKASDGKGGQMTLMYQSALKYVTSGDCGIEKAKIEERLKNFWTYEGAGLKDGYELVKVFFFDASGKKREILVSEFRSHNFGSPTLEFPLNMENPVPFAVMNWYYGGQGGGGMGADIYEIESDGEKASLCFVADYEWLDTDGGSTGMGYHYYKKSEVGTYVFQEEYGEVQKNITRFYNQKNGWAPWNYIHGEPSGKSRTLKKGQYANPICRLKMRASPNLYADKINTINPGTLLQIVDVGEKTTIDGIKANWVKVKAVNKTRFLEGYKFDGSGRVFGGYLE